MSQRYLSVNVFLRNFFTKHFVVKFEADDQIGTLPMGIKVFREDGRYHIRYSSLPAFLPDDLEKFVDEVNLRSRLSVEPTLESGEHRGETEATVSEPYQMMSSNVWYQDIHVTGKTIDSVQLLYRRIRAGASPTVSWEGKRSRKELENALQMEESARRAWETTANEVEERRAGVANELADAVGFLKRITHIIGRSWTRRSRIADTRAIIEEAAGVGFSEG